MEKVKKLTAKKLIIILAAVFVVCGLALGALVLSKGKVKEVATNDDYGYVNPDETKAEADAGFTIDGVFDEEVYKNNKWLYLENSQGGANVNIAITSHFGEKGMYFAYDVDEKNPIYVNLDRAAYLNSCVEMYLAPSYLSSLKGNSAFEIDMLPTGDLSFKKTNGKGGWINVATTNDVMAYLGATTKGGKVNTEECTGYTLELFIPWSYMEQLGIDVDSVKNGYVYVNPAHITSFNETGTDTNIDRYHYWFAQQIGAGWNNVDAFFRFDTNGVQGSVPVETVQGSNYTISGASDVIPGMKNTYTITPKDGHAITSLLVNGEEYIKDVSFTKDGEIILPLRGKLEGLKIEAKTESVTDGNKTLSVTVASNKKGGDSLANATITCKGPDGFEDVTLDAAGKFVLTDARQGYYTISVEKEGYDKAVRTIYLNRDMETNVTLDYDRFEVVSGTAWLLDDQNKDLLYKFGGNNAVILSKDSYSDFAVESTFQYDTELAKLSENDNFVQQRQGYRFAFSNDKVWHVDILKEKDRFIIQYAKFSGDKSMTNWQNVYTLTKEEVAKLQSKDGVKFEVQRSGRVVNFLIGGKVVANEYLDKEYANLKAKVGFESWIANRTVREIPFSITSKKISVSGAFKASNGWDLSKQNAGIITAVGGSANNGEFTNWVETFFDTYRDISVVAKDVKNDGNYSLIYKFEFNNGLVYYARIQNSAKEQIVQVMGSGNDFTTKWERVCKLDKAQIEKLTTDGIEFRVAIIDETAHFFLDGIEVGTDDISKTSDGKASKIKNESATISVRMDGNVGETVSMTYELNQVAIAIQKARYGTITTDKESYTAGETVILTAKNSDGTPCKEIVVDGKTVKMNANGTYSFKAQTKGHIVEGIFKQKEIFASTDSWDLSKEHQGILTVVGGNAGKGQSTVVTTKDNSYREVALKAQLQKSADKYSLIAFWNFTNGEKYIARISEENSRVIVQAMPTGNTFLKENDWQMIAKFSDAQAEKLRTEGVELRMALVGETMYFMLDGQLVGTRDLSKKSDGKASKIANETAQVQIRLDGNTGSTSQVSYELKKVAIVNPTAKYGTVTTDKVAYTPGETVTVTVKNRHGEVCKDYVIDGKKVSLDTNGQYSFKAKVSGHALIGQEYFKSDAQWNLDNQGTGSISVVGQKNQTTKLLTKDNIYRGITVNVRDNDAATNGFAAQVNFVFTNGEKLSVRLHNTDADVNKYTVQLMDNSDDTFVKFWTTIGEKFDSTLTNKIRSEAGVDFTAIIVGEELRTYIDGKLWGTYSLEKNQDGNDANMAYVTATIGLRIYQNEGYNNEIDFTLYKAAVNVKSVGHGEVQTNALGYELGDTVTLQLQPKSGYACSAFKVDGKDAELNNDGTYSFKVTKVNHKVEAEFKKSLFNENSEWNAIKQYFGTLIVPETTDGDSGWLESARTYTEIKATAKYHAHEEGTPFALVESFKFANGSHVSVRLTNDGNKWKLQSLNDSVFKWTEHYYLSKDEIAKVTGDGIEFKMVREGTTLKLYLDGKQVGKDLDLTKNLDSQSTGITAGMNATVRLRLYANKGYETVIPFELVGGPETVEVVIKDTEHGTIEAIDSEYYVGDKITVKVTGDSGYYYKTLKVDDKKVSLNWDGTYTFEATKTVHEIEGTFAKTIFTSSSVTGLNLTKQHDGILKGTGTTSGAGAQYYAETIGHYSVVTMLIKNPTPATTNTTNYAVEAVLKFESETAGVANQILSMQVCNWNKNYFIKSVQNGLYPAGREYYRITDDATLAKIADEGVELKIVRDGTKVMFYLDGELLTLNAHVQNGSTYLDLTQGYEGENNLGSALCTMKTKISFRNWNGTCEIPFTLSNSIIDNQVDGTHGAITFAKPLDEYAVGDKVVMTATPEKGYSPNIQVNGKQVMFESNGTYTFTAKKGDTITGVFEKNVWDAKTNWNVLNQTSNVLSTYYTGNGSGWLDAQGAYSDITIRVKDYLGVNKSTTAANNGIAFESRVIFQFDTNGDKVTDINAAVRLYNNGGTYQLQGIGGNGYVYNWAFIMSIKDADLIKKIQNEGIDWRIVRDGTTLKMYLDGEYVSNNAARLDLTKLYNSTTPTGITATTPVLRVSLAHYGNQKCDVEIPFEASKTVQAATIDTSGLNTTKGTVTFNYDSYIVGQKVTMKVTPSNGYSPNIQVNGKQVVFESDGTYIFTAKETNIITGTFDKNVWDAKTNWNVLNQTSGVLSTYYTGTGSGWLDAQGAYSDITIRVKDYLGVTKSTAAANGGTAFEARVIFQFDTNGDGTPDKNAAVRLYNNGGTYQLQGIGGTNYVYNNAFIMSIKDANLIKKIQDEGIDWRVVREGTKLKMYLDGQYVSNNAARLDLTTVYNTATPTGITAQTPVIRATLVNYGNQKCNIEIPFALSKTVQTATVDKTGLKTENGAVAFDRDSYIVGQKVTMTVTPDSGYYHKLKVNGKEVILDANNTYTFTAKANNTITGTFAKSLFSIEEAANWDVTNQHSGRLVVSANVADSKNISGKDTGYTQITAIVKDTGAEGFAFEEKFTSVDKNWFVGVKLTENNGDWVLQSNSDTSFGNKIHYTLTKDEVAKVTGDGIEYKMVRNGTYLHLYLDGRKAATLDFTANSKGVVAATPFTANFRVYETGSKKLVIEYSVTNPMAELQSVLSGKNISILGDSISTYKGYSNDAVNRNSTIGNNAIYYHGSNYITSVNDTWWMRTALRAGLDLLVNNAWSGDKVITRGLERCVQLHDDTGENAGTNPDIIAVYLGINDFDSGVAIDTFRTSYDEMISKMAERYPDADIFLLNYVPNKANTRTIAEMEQYNQIVKDTAAKYGCTLVDLYNNSGITAANAPVHMGDGAALHPNALGMAVMSETFTNALYNKYVTP